MSDPEQEATHKFDFFPCLFHLHTSLAVSSSVVFASGKTQKVRVLEEKMKFCKKYEEYMQEQTQGRAKKLPAVGFKKLKKTLKRCRRHGGQSDADNSHVDSGNDATCLQQCPVCDGTFFPSLIEEMSAVVGFFNKRAQRLLEVHLASGFSKCYIWLKEKLKGNHVRLIHEGRDLVTYAIINALAMRKILKKYDKVHYSKQGQAFKSQAQRMQLEILQSPWLCELIAFHINMRQSKVKSRDIHELLSGCSIKFRDERPSISCDLLESVKLDIDLTCSICLETLFDPVSLKCGHIFCYTCACKAASVTIVDRLKAAHPKEKCPMCREAGVYAASVHLEELHILLSQSCPEYWAERRKSEKAERIEQAKKYWEAQRALIIGT